MEEVKKFINMEYDLVPSDVPDKDLEKNPVSFLSSKFYYIIITCKLHIISPLIPWKQGLQVYRSLNESEVNKEKNKKKNKVEQA